MKTWFTDQLIITWALLSSKVCTVPSSSALWDMPGLQFDPSLDDSKTCFHGNVNIPCTIKRRSVKGGCKWWHFSPDQGFQSHLDTFYELTNNTIVLDPEILNQQDKIYY